MHSGSPVRSAGRAGDVLSRIPRTGTRGSGLPHCRQVVPPGGRSTGPQRGAMSAASSASPGVVIGLDIGGTSTNATVLGGFGRFLVDDLCETPSRVLEGPEASLDALRQAFDGVLVQTGVPL